MEQEQAPKKNKNIFCIIKKIWKVFEKILMIAIIFISLIIVTQRITNNDKSFLGFRIFRVQTGSMIPVYEIGDVILVKQKDVNKIQIGDDVTYWGTSGIMKGKLVTHRVINIEEVDGEKVFRTQGVANNAEDPPVRGELVNGVVLGKLPIITKITTVLSDTRALYFLGILPLTILIFFSFMKDKVKDYER